MADYYVDPSIATDTGSGTKGSPWGSTTNHIQRAMNLITAAATGDAIHVKSAGSVDFSATNLDFTSYGATSNEKTLTISGYTADEWDGGRATINLNGASQFIASTVNGMQLIDLDISGGTGSWCVGGNDFISAFRCKFDGNATTGGLDADNYVRVIGCYFTNLGGQGIVTSTVAANVSYNYIVQNANQRAIYSTHAAHNIIKVTRTGSVNIIGLQDGGVAANNTIYSTVACTGQGILVTAANEGCEIWGNYIEGLNGTGGDAIEVVSGGVAPVVLSNRWYLCTNGITTGGVFRLNEDNSATSASGLVDAANDDFRPTTELRGNGTPASYLGLAGNATYFDIGAIQTAGPAIMPQIRDIY